jgi:hypothetical protein
MSSMALDLRVRDLAGWIVRTWLAAVMAASWALTVAMVVYACTIVYGVAAGYALPTATIFYVFPALHVLHRTTLYLPWALLIVGAMGALCGWIGIASPEVLQERERKLIRFWAYAGFPVIVLIFLVAMSVGGWSGRFTPVEFNYAATGGLVPYSDAKSYFGSAFEIGYWGNWDWVASQRPFAAAMRNLVVLLGGESYQGSLIAQAVLVAVAMMFALRSVVAWRGLWVGIAFFAFGYGLARPYLLTAMTEPLGLIWSLVSIAFFIEAIRKHSIGCALVGFAALTAALMIRMGSMFTIPLLMLWIPLAFASGWALKLKVFAGVVAIALGILLANSLLAALYAAPGSDTSGNLSDVLCGLAHGSNWATCANMLAAQLSTISSTHLRNLLVYDEAWRAIVADPTVALYAYWRNIVAYVASLAELLVEGYCNNCKIISKEHIDGLLILLMPGWVWMVSRKGGGLLLLFTFSIVISTILSAGIVFADDGLRSMEVTYAIMALLFAIGLASPASLVQPVERMLLSWRRGAVAITLALLGFLVIPTLQGAAVRAATNFHGPVPPDVPNVSIVGGAPTLTGFLVLPDGVQRPRDLPAFDASTFNAMYKFLYTAELGPSAVSYLPQPPFAMVFSPTQNRPDYRWDFITPTEVLTDKTAHRWQFQIELEKSPPQGLPFLLVSKATPME